ncbi:unnamed protein product [Didymodactylos carnosus]|uniref:Uncharacterized protein n=2 Tax=Didymodactylos carnosus TaxID=1234261 RepID=A0A8S2DU17_9BILA|nr:unnamed protein product [Didymodactylos carnosus]CAF3818164.1 unnamed protein product [Didymodactylos carnosus]
MRQKSFKLHGNSTIQEIGNPNNVKRLCGYNQTHLKTAHCGIEMLQNRGFVTKAVSAIESNINSGAI